MGWAKYLKSALKLLKVVRYFLEHIKYAKTGSETGVDTYYMLKWPSKGGVLFYVLFKNRWDKQIF